MQDITVLKFLKIMPSPHRFLSRSKSMRFSFLMLFGFLFGCTQSPTPGVLTVDDIGASAPVVVPERMIAEELPRVWAKDMGLARFLDVRPTGDGLIVWALGQTFEGKTGLWSIDLAKPEEFPKLVLSPAALSGSGLEVVDGFSVLFFEAQPARLWFSGTLSGGSHGTVSAFFDPNEGIKWSGAPVFAASEAFVFQHTAGFRMYYRCPDGAYDTICTAQSKDGHRWVAAARPVVEQSPLPPVSGFSSAYFGEPFVLKSGSDYRLFFSRYVRQSAQKDLSVIVTVAVDQPDSVGGKHLLILLRPKVSWVAMHMSNPSMVGSGASARVIFLGDHGQGIGMATGRSRPHSDGSQAPVQAVKIDERVARVVVTETGDTAVARAGDVEVMFRRVESGNFLMGSDISVVGRDPDELQKEVTISRDFWLGTTEVTQAFYTAVMGINPAQHIGPQRPVERVSWDEAVAFCNRLSELSGRRPAYVEGAGGMVLQADSDGFRLPTEAEWEYAARKGALDSMPLDDHAWFVENSDMTTHPVGLREPSRIGIYDMMGNVYEWTSDAKRPYDALPSIDPIGRGHHQFMIERGGSFRNGYKNMRVANRGRLPPQMSSMNLGLRLALW
jgi:formylglycine-generating enzyme required for sulfatase activity